jgi:uncharacterized protein (TIGR00266 family)
MGDIQGIDLSSSREIYVHPGAYIAHTSGVELVMQWAGFTGWLTGRGLFQIKLSGNGKAFIAGYGGLSKKRISGDLIVEKDYLVGYDSQVRLKIELTGNLIRSLIFRKGVRTRVSGNGFVFLQSRNIESLVTYLRRKVL